ncbi:MAG: transposase [Planctomycetes bacterium]|nr:transposase [Planctomycetota bacterium]
MQCMEAGLVVGETTDASVGESRTLETMVEQHEANTDLSPTHVVADKAYGTAENYQYLRDLNLQPCIPHRHPRVTNTNAYPKSTFTYDAEADQYVCPAGVILKRRSKQPNTRGQTAYRADSSTCRAFSQREACFGGKVGKRGKSLCRIAGQDAIDWADDCLGQHRRRHLMSRRKSVIEGSFGDAATHHGFKRSCWRRLWRVKVQNLLIATLQNMRKLLKYGRQRPRRAALAIRRAILWLQTATRCPRTLPNRHGWLPSGI